ncbi:MAG: hypothetical protein M3P00_11125 [Gemmatimonadota bacterium]|nr:hypothetical protein [Gemmatimonadota bacterium]
MTTGAGQIIAPRLLLCPLVENRLRRSIYRMIEIHPVSGEHALAAAQDLIRAHLDAHSQHHDAAAKAVVLAALPAPYVPPAGGLWWGTSACG